MNEQLILEKEDFESKNIYWLEKGEIHVYKKINHIYDYTAVHPDSRTLINMNCIKPLELFHNPKDGPFSKIGVCLGSFTMRDTIIAEDAGLFK